jgi:pyridoxamine 5'-phosphate oxidase
MSEFSPLYREAIDLFRERFARVTKLGLKEPHAMSLATCDASGQPSVRTVLLRGVDERGFVFFTNSQSRKGSQMAANPRVGLCLFWDSLQEQVHIEGRIERVSDPESDHYWKSRPRLSQVGAWASLQSQPLDARETLLKRLEDVEAQYEGADVPRPPHWFGFRVVPHRIEFWNGREGRLHERIVYELRDSEWHVGSLYP